MPVPASNDEFLDLIRKSGVVEDIKLNTYLDKLKSANIEVSDQPSKFAGRLVRDGILTYFQAEQILQGKYKRFSIGKYKVLEKLGVGGMGQVFLCEHKVMRRRVAVKVLPVDKSTDDSARERFHREARAVAALDHPNIVRAFDVDQDDNLHFLVMEYVEGINFHDLVKKHGPLDALRASHYIYGAAAGLEYANSMGIVHRDIKPGNILVDRGGVVKILDMGLARLTKDTDDNLTQKFDENVLGTADYLPPEQAIDSTHVDIRADIYSLGCTFYFMLTGSAPFPDGSVAQKLLAHQVKEPKPISEIRPEVPEEIIAIVAKMMMKNANDRFQTPAELMGALTPMVQTPIPPPAEKEMPQISRAAGGSTPTAHRPTALAMMPSAISASASGIPILSFPSGGSNSGLSTKNSNVFNTPAPAAAIWEDIAQETATKAGDTVPEPVSGKKKLKPEIKRPSRVKTEDPEPVETGTKKKKLLVIGVFAGVLAVGGLVAALVFGSKSNTGSGSNAPHPPSPVTGVRVLYVTKSTSQAPDTTFPTLAAALKKVNPGDTISIIDDPHEEPPVRIVSISPGKLKDVTIEAGNPAKSVRFRLPDGAIQGKDRGIFEINGADGLKIRNLTLDVADRIDYGITITGPVDRLTFENVTVQRPHSAGFLLERAFGSPDQPIRIDRCAVLTTGPNCDGVLIKASAKAAVNHVAITNSRFFGQGWNALHIVGTTQGIEFRNNRIFNFDSGVRLDGPELSYQMKITNNTFLAIKDSGVMVTATPPVTPASEMFLELNLFAKTKDLLKGPRTIPGLKAAHNARDKESKSGPNAQAGEVPYGLATPITEDPATFLRIEEDKVTTIIDGKKVKIGARD
ncbi:hypothetical protein BH11PLA2_BH11PLA2_28350 [soil metagenome]